MNFNRKLYNDKSLNLIRDILGSSKYFNSSNNKIKKEIADKVKNISLLSNMSLNFNDNKTEILNILNNLDILGLEEFKNIFKSRVNEPITRKNSGSLNNQFKKIFMSCFDVLKEDSNKDLNNDHVFDIVIKKLNYDEILFIVLNSALLCIEMKDYDTIESVDLCEIDNSYFFYKLRENLYKFILVKIAEIIIDKDEYENILIKKFSEIEKNINSKSFESINNLTKQVEEIFIFSLRITVKELNIKFIKGGYSSKKISVLPKNIVDSTIISSHLPEIVKPNSWDEKSLENQLKIYKNKNTKFFDLYKKKK